MPADSTGAARCNDRGISARPTGSYPTKLQEPSLARKGARGVYESKWAGAVREAEEGPSWITGLVVIGGRADIGPERPKRRD
jgi:hypothetical protein